MNMEQQRKAFEEWVLKHPDYRALTDYEENIMFDAWLAAQQQEGYVMVPVEPTEGMLDASRRRQWDDLSSPYEDMDMLKYKAMIQASQE